MFLQMKTVRNNLKWSYILDHQYSISITEGSGSVKTNELSNVINEQDRYKSTSIDKIHSYAKE